MMEIKTIIGTVLNKMLPVFIVITLLLLSGNALGLAFPLLLKVIIDDVIIKGAFESMPSLLLVFSLLSLASIVSRFFCNYLTAFSIEKVSYFLKDRLYRHLQSLPLSFIQKKSMGDIISYFAIDVADISGFFSSVLLKIVNDVLMIVIIITILIILHAKLALICLGVYPLFFIILVLSKKYILKKSELIRAINNDHNKKIHDDFSNIKLTKLFAAESHRASLYDTLEKSLIRQRLEIFFTNGLLTNGMLVFNTISTILLFGFGSIFVHTTGMDLLTIGGLSAFYTYLFNLYQPVNSIVDVNIYYKQVKVSMGKLNDIFTVKREPEHGLLTDLPGGGIRFSDVCFKYDKEMILDNVSFGINAGEKAALVGRNGIGKSTIVNLLVRLFEADAGNICIDNQDISQYSLKCLRQRIGVLSQELHFYEDSIRNNLLLGMEEVTHDDMMAAAVLSGADEFIQELPDGFNTIIREKGANFSIGQLRKLAITRIILKNPGIIIFDEPTSSLDEAGMKQFYELFETVFSGKTILFVTHNREQVKHGDKLLVLEKRKIRELNN